MAQPSFRLKRNKFLTYLRLFSIILSGIQSLSQNNREKGYSYENCDIRRRLAGHGARRLSGKSGGRCGSDNPQQGARGRSQRGRRKDNRHGADDRPRPCADPGSDDREIRADHPAHKAA